MKLFTLKLFRTLFNIGVDTISESANTVKMTLRVWSYLSIVFFGSIVLAILYGLYSLSF